MRENLAEHTTSGSPTLPHCRVSSEARALLILLLVTLLGAWLAMLQPAAAQPPLQLPPKTYPSETYYQALAVYRTGELSEAVRGFEQALSQTRRDTQGRWIDAIPVHAMLAECHYEAGNLALAHQHLDAALQISTRFPQWIGSLQWPPPQEPVMRSINRAPWWTGRPLVPAHVPRKVQFNFVTTSIGAGPDGNAAIGAQASAQQIDAVEILRGLGMVFYRRQVLLGPLAVSEPLLKASLGSIGNASPAAGPVGVATINSVKTIGNLTNGAGAPAAQSATGLATINGNLIHPLTPLLLCSAARTLSTTDNPETAYPLALQAAAAAALLDQPEWSAEAFEIAVGVKPAAASAELYQSAAAAMQVSDRSSRLGAARIGSVVVEAAMDAGRPNEAAQALQSTATLLANRNVELPHSAAYHQYVTARMNAAAGQLNASDLAIKNLVSFTGRPPRNESTPRLYQLRLIENAARNAALGGKTAEALLEQYLRPPPRHVWLNDPVNALGYIASDRSLSMAAWIRSAASRNAGEDVLIRGDVQAASAFNAMLPLDGRVLQARWLAAAPEAALSPAAIAIRKAPPTALARLRQLASQPVPGDPALARKQADAAESAAYTLALQRTDLPVAFPRPLTAKSDWEPLADEDAVLAFIPAGDNVLGVLATNNKTTVWPVAGFRTMPQQIARLMQEVGVVRRRSGTAQLPADDQAWQAMALSIRDRLIPNMELLAQTKRLAIVPTGALWYLPFEMLPTAEAGSARLNAATKITYAPTPGLAIHAVPASDSNLPVAILTDLFFAPRDAERNEEIAQTLQAAVENPLVLPGPASAPGQWIGASSRHLVVAAPVTPAKAPLPFAWSPLVYDGGMPGGQLADWMRLPFQPPESLALPGLRTGAVQAQAGHGEELFYASMALHASGVSKLILSRWPVGGESTGLLLKEYVQELPFIGSDAAWRRGVAIMREAELDPTREPLLTSGDAEHEQLTGDQPLFWAGYMQFGGLTDPVD